MNTYQQMLVQIEFIKFNLANYINGSSKNINLDNIESKINMYTVQLNSLLSKHNKAPIKNESDTFIC